MDLTGIPHVKMVLVQGVRYLWIFQPLKLHVCVKWHTSATKHLLRLQLDRLMVVVLHIKKNKFLRRPFVFSVSLFLATEEYI